MSAPHRRFTRFCVAIALASLLVTFASGCGGGGKGTVSGEVTVGGKPLPMGIIVFTPDSGPAVAAEILDGKYSAVGVPSGNVSVSLDLNSLKQQAEKAGPKSGGGAAAVAAKFGKSDDVGKQKSMAPGTGGPGMPDEAKEYYAKQKESNAEAGRRIKDALVLLPEIPEKYSDPKLSGWSLKVSKGDNTFDAKVVK